MGGGCKEWEVARRALGVVPTVEKALDEWELLGLLTSPWGILMVSELRGLASVWWFRAGGLRLQLTSSEVEGEFNEEVCTESAG